MTKRLTQDAVTGPTSLTQSQKRRQCLARRDSVLPTVAPVQSGQPAQLERHQFGVCCRLVLVLTVLVRRRPGAAKVGPGRGPGQRGQQSRLTQVLGHLR